MSFKVARLEAGHTPRTRELVVATVPAQAFTKGALLLADAANNWAECGADPAVIGAVALSDYLADTSGFSHTARTEFPTGSMQGALVRDGVRFIGEKVIGGADPVVGSEYGVILDVDGRWKIDTAEAVATRVHVHRLVDDPIDQNKWEVTFLAANCQNL